MNLRPATLADAAMLLSWRNDPVTRAMFVNSEPVELEAHIAWLTGYLEKPSTHHRLYIAEFDGPVGTIRLDRNAQAVWTLSYTVAPEERGKRYAAEMLGLLRERPLLAAIKPENTASIRAVIKAGFQKSKSFRGELEHWFRFR